MPYAVRLMLLYTWVVLGSTLGFTWLAYTLVG